MCTTLDGNGKDGRAFSVHCGDGTQYRVQPERFGWGIYRINGDGQRLAQVERWGDIRHVLIDTHRRYEEARV